MSCIKWIEALRIQFSDPTAPNLLNRNVDVEVPNKVWTFDISHVWTHEGWLYLTVVKFKRVF